MVAILDKTVGRAVDEDVDELLVLETTELVVELKTLLDELTVDELTMVLEELMTVDELATLLEVLTIVDELTTLLVELTTDDVLLKTELLELEIELVVAD